MAGFISKLKDITRAGYEAAVRLVLLKKSKLLGPRQLKREEDFYRDVESRLKPYYATKGSKLSSELHNRNQEALFIALYGLDRAVNAFAAKHQKNQILSRSQLNKAREALASALREAAAFSIRYRHPDVDEVLVPKLRENFTTQEPAAYVDPDLHVIRAAAVNYVDARYAEHLAAASDVEVTFLGGGAEAGLDALLPPNAMVDYHDETAWGESILSDGPITVTVGDTTYHGPVADVVITIALPQPVNYLRLLPFSFYPMKLVGAWYKSAATAEEWVEVPEFVTTYLDGTYVHYFNPITIAQLKLRLVQEHPKLLSIAVPKDSIKRSATLTAILKARNEAIAGLADTYVKDSLKPIADEAQRQISKLFNPTQLDTWSQKLLDLGEAIIQELGEKTDESEIITKFEYLFGLRSVDLGLLQFAPTSYFESEKFLPGASVARVSLSVGESCPDLTSTEWAIDFGRDKVVPILPLNSISGSLGVVKSERLDVSLAVPHDTTRFPVTGAWTIKVDGEPLATGEYTGVYLTGGQLQITINNPGVGAYYTIDYFTPVSSTVVDVLEEFSSRPLDQPEVFHDTGPDNDIELSLYPYIAYEVINDTGNFRYDSMRNEWTYKRPYPLYEAGHLVIWPRVLDSYGHILVSGSNIASGVAASFGRRSGQSAPDFESQITSMGTGYFNPPFGYYFGVEGFSRAFKVVGATGAVLYLEEPPTFTLSEVKLMDARGFSGNLTGAPYSARVETPYHFGIGLERDGIIYGFEAGAYNPITVTVGGEPAVNCTNYETLEHRAFSSKNVYQFIQAGRTIYFNKPIHRKEIQVNYRWMVEYVKVKGEIKGGSSFAADITPVVSGIYVMVDTTVL